MQQSPTGIKHILDESKTNLDGLTPSLKLIYANKTYRNQFENCFTWQEP